MEDFFNQNPVVALSIYLIMTACVAVLSVCTSKSATALRDKAQLPEGVVAGILIGVITSIPELISGVTGVIQYARGEGGVEAEGSAVFGDVIGSNMFCIFALALILIIFVQKFAKREVNQSNTITLIFVVMGGIFCLLAGLFDNKGLIYKDSPSPIVWHGFNFFSILILSSYIAAVFFMIFGSKRVKAKTVVMKWHETQTILPSDQKNKRKWFVSLKLGIIIFLFIIFSILLITCSMFMALGCESLIDNIPGLDPIIGRTVLLGISTSLPELITIISFCTDKEYNMAIDSTVGSCGFNFSILFIANIAYAIVYPGIETEQAAMFALNKSAVMQLSLFLMQGILLLGYLIANSQSIKQYLNKKQSISLNATLLSLICMIYVIYIILGFVYS